MHSSRQPRLLGSVLVLFLLILVAFVSGPDPASARTKAKAKITWQPTTIEVSLLAGTSTVREAIFSSSGDIEDVSFFVTPELEPFLSVESYGLDAVKSDSSYSLLLRFDVPLSTAAGIYEGTVHLRDGNRTVPQTLKVLVQIEAISSAQLPTDIALPSESRIVTDDQGVVMVRDELVVGLAWDLLDPETRISEIAEATGGTVIGAIPDLAVYQLHYAVPSESHLTSLAELVRVMSGVDFVTYHDFAITTQSTNPPDDPEYKDEWSENLDPHTQRWWQGDNYNLEMIKAMSAWERTTGSSDVVVAVIDGDIEADHEDLRANVLSVSGVRDKNLGHGTHVAGTICAEGNNGIGVTGVAWTCSLRAYNLRYFGPVWKRAFDNVEVVATMLRAVHDGADIVNMSLSIPKEISEDKLLEQALQFYSLPMRHAMEHASAKEPDDDGVLWILCAGNDGADTKRIVPAALADEKQFPNLNVISVANVNASGSLGLKSNYGDSVTVAAPGTSIVSTVPYLLPPFLPGFYVEGDGYDKMTGTSMAAPHVSGLAALVKAVNPDKNAAELRRCIVTAAKSYGPQVPGHAFHVISAPEAVLCDFPETPTLQRIEVHGRSMSDNGRYVVHDAPERRVPQLDTNFHTDIYMYDLLGPNPGDNPVLASVSVNGIAGNLASRLRWDQLAVSNSGRVVFQSGATDLVAGDTNRVQDIFIRDFSVEPPVTVQVSVRSDGTPNRTYYDMPALNPSISTDGRYAVFESDFRYASMAWYGISDIYLRDIDDSSTYLVSQNRENPLRSGNADSTGGLVSPNGEVVVFNTLASDIGMGITDNNGLSDVYLYDIAQGQVVERISVGNDGSEANGNSVLHSISRDGRFVLFYSTAQGLEVDGGSNSGNYYYLYLRDRDLQTTTEIDKIWNGYDLSRSRMVRISGDGRYLAFWANQWTPGHSDVLLWEHESDVITRLSQGYDFIADVPVEPSNGSSMIGFINNDTQIAFLSAANNLVPDDDNGEVVDLFIYTIP